LGVVLRPFGIEQIAVRIVGELVLVEKGLVDVLHAFSSTWFPG
jgi:hypothetical protein